MKTAISMPDPLFNAAEAEAKRQGVSRSKLIQIALERYLEAQHGMAVTQSINRSIANDPVAATEDETVLELNRRAMAQLLKDDEWEDAPR